MPQNVYSLNTDKMTPVAGAGANRHKALEIAPGQTVQLPNGLGSVSVDGVKRFVGLDIHHDPAQGWVLLFAILILAGLLTSLFVPRRRIWVKAVDNADGSLTLEYAGPRPRGRPEPRSARSATSRIEHSAVTHPTRRNT